MSTTPLAFGEPLVLHLPSPDSFGGPALQADELVQVRAMQEAIEWVVRQLPCIVTPTYDVWTPWWARVLYDAEIDIDGGNEIVRCVTDTETRAIYLKQIIRESLRNETLGGSVAAQARIRLRSVPNELRVIAAAYPDRLDACLRDPVAYAEAKQLVAEGMQAMQNLRDSQ